MIKKDKKIVIITGISGAGKTTTIQCLEDIGYFCIDNMPLDFIQNILETFMSSNNNQNINKIAFGINIKEYHLSENFNSVINNLRQKNYNFKTIFLEADDQVILRRFSETRRKHPLSSNDKPTKSSLLNDILKEKKLLKPIKDKADRLINTSNMNSLKLKEMIKQIFSGSSDDLIINLVSFGFKYGVPIDTDMLFDARFLPNPYYDPNLKPLTGNDKKIQNFVMKPNSAQLFLSKIKDMFDFLIPEFEKEGKSYLTIGIGCTGGKHRSVTIVNKLREYFESKPKNTNICVIHRDIVK